MAETRREREERRKKEVGEKERVGGGGVVEVGCRGERCVVVSWKGVCVGEEGGVCRSGGVVEEWWEGLNCGGGERVL